MYLLNLLMDVGPQGLAILRKRDLFGMVSSRDPNSKVVNRDLQLIRESKGHELNHLGYISFTSKTVFFLCICPGMFKACCTQGTRT